MLKNRETLAKIDYSNINEWYSSKAGLKLAKDIEQALSDSLLQCFGYYAVQIGCPNLANVLVEKSRVRHHFSLDTFSHADMAARHEQLPIATDSVDLVISAHALAFSSQPHEILREIDRVLVPEGKLIIIEMNPLSFWGLRHFVQGWLEKMPWTGRLYSHKRLRDWLAILGFKEINALKVHYELPLAHPYKFTNWLSKATKRWLPLLSALNVLVYEKSITPITPIKSMWKQSVIGASTVSTSIANRHLKNGQSNNL